jgi:kynurenine formamidase
MQSQARREPMSESDALKLFETCSNRGRWGDDDERGTLNLISPEKRIGAAQLVRDGVVVPTGRSIDTKPSAKNYLPAIHRMLYVSHDDAIGCVDTFEIAPHGFAVTHLDAIGHVYFDGSMYNGRSPSEEARADGLHWASIGALADGIFTRGVLLDIAAVRGKAWLDEDEYIWPEDLDEAERRAGVAVEAGDVIFVHTGLEARERAQGTEDPSRRAGLSADCVPWLFERDIAAYAGDCIERLPHPYSRLISPLHMVGMVAMGLVMLDSPQTEPIVDACTRFVRSEFLVTCAPWVAPLGTGSPVNPLCIF